MAHLLATSGADAGHVFELTSAGVTRIGRHHENAIVLGDSSVSRFHAEVEARGGRYSVRDLGSTHGTFVNGARCDAEMALNHGDAVRLGVTEFVFQHAAAAGRPPFPGHLVVNGVPTFDDEMPGLGNETIAARVAAAQGNVTHGLSARHAEALSQVARAIQSVFDINALLGTLMDLVFDIFRPDRGVVLLYEGPERRLVPRVKRPEREDFQVSRTVLDHAVEHQMALLVADMETDSRFSAAESIMAQSVRAAICCPLICREKVLGVLYIDTQSHLLTYQKDELVLLNIIAANAAIAIENAILVQEKLEAERLAAIGVAIAGISHYVKNVLTGIGGSEKLIEMGLAQNNLAVVRQAWPILVRSNVKITTLVKDMLTYSKKREPDWGLGSLNALLREVHEQQLPRAEERKIALDLEIDVALPDSYFDSRTLFDTVLNIVGNAIEACEGRPEARVVLQSKCDARGDRALLAVRDNGPGIPPEIRRRILEPFFSTKGSKGTGLGLAVARKCVEEHGGQLEIESEVGAGTTFCLVLPLRHEAPAGDSR